MNLLKKWFSREEPPIPQQYKSIILSIEQTNYTSEWVNSAVFKQDTRVTIQIKESNNLRVPVGSAWVRVFDGPAHAFEKLSFLITDLKGWSRI